MSNHLARAICESLDFREGSLLADAVEDAVRDALASLVVIDPESPGDVARLADAFCNARWSHLPGSDECDPLTRSSMQAALREFATPKPPKPDEPQGLGAVVEDADGTPWVRIENRPNITGQVWASAFSRKRPDRSDTAAWSDIDVVRILHEGVPS